MAPKRRFFAPEVIQTSAMDCGPASLKSLLEGFLIPVSYGRLREACQTDVDGTSIDVLEDVCGKLGLKAEQVMLPLDHVLISSTDALPALIIWRNTDGAPHFVVVWRQVGGFVQVMDPGFGRRWMRANDLLENLYVHSMLIPAEAFREWADSDEFLDGLRFRLRSIGAETTGAKIVAACKQDPTWESFASLDATVRMVTALIAADGLDKGPQSDALLASLYAKAREAMKGGEGELDVVPRIYWTASRATPDEDGTIRVRLTGCVLVKALGLRDKAAEASASAAPTEPLSPELAAALSETPTRPGLELVRMMRQDGLLTPATVLLALVLAAMGGAVEALVFRGLLQIGGHLGPPIQRVGAVVVLLVLLIALLGVELPMTGGMFRMGRRLEARLRVAFLSKIPKLSDRYFHSRPTSDMAQRCHAIHPVRQLPSIAGHLVKSAMDLVVTACGLIWIEPKSWPYVAVAIVLSIAVPWVAQRTMVERDLRVRAFDGSLTQFYRDALLGLVPIRTHGAERPLRTEHSGMLMDWMRASYDRLRAAVAVEAVEAAVGALLAVFLTFNYLRATAEPAAVLLLLYWALSIPQLGQELALGARQYPAIRNLMMRLLEPLNALEDEEGTATGANMAKAPAPFAQPKGVELRFSSVAVRAAGRTILDPFDLHIRAGEHVAIVGPSGAGKSSFVGLLLGWHRAAGGSICVDGQPLRGDRLLALRKETAWIDPGVQLWNRSLLENLEYGSANDADVGRVVLESDLIGLLERLPHGLQTELGEGGGLVSGGEGQRVRLGRAMMRPESRLVILDEPFRGLDREKRRALLKRVRHLWKNATVLCVTHDVGETTNFDRVLVIEDGAIKEDGRPHALEQQCAGRYRALLDAEKEVRDQLWAGGQWRRVTVHGGTVTEERNTDRATAAGREP